MVHYDRRLKIALPSRQSAFLWGPRKTGKSTYLKATFPNSLVYDFLKTDLMLDFNRRPALLREQLLAQPDAVLARPIILDEVQRVPLVLDEVHWLIENKGLRFILCGSSARKLKRGRANLLGGRAWRYEMFPLVTDELPDSDVDLLTILNRGLIPDHFATAQYRRSLNAYLQDYLKEEVFAEGLTRNIPAFSRFFDALGYTHGELTNFSNIARECGVSSKTVKEYYQILVDTLLGRVVEPFKRRQSRQVISKASKFYLFDDVSARWSPMYQYLVLTSLRDGHPLPTRHIREPMGGFSSHFHISLSALPFLYFSFRFSVFHLPWQSGLMITLYCRNVLITYS